MHPLLDKLLAKRKIKDIIELSSEEKVQFDEWQRVLSEGEMSVDKIGEFCSHQLDIIKGQMKNIDNSDDKNKKLVIYLNLYDTLLTLIKSPQAERESLIKYLTQLLQ